MTFPVQSGVREVVKEPLYSSAFSLSLSLSSHYLFNYDIK